MLEKCLQSREYKVWSEGYKERVSEVWNCRLLEKLMICKWRNSSHLFGKSKKVFFAQN